MRWFGWRSDGGVLFVAGATTGRSLIAGFCGWVDVATPLLHVDMEVGTSEGVAMMGRRLVGGVGLVVRGDGGMEICGWDF